MEKWMFLKLSNQAPALRGPFNFEQVKLEIQSGRLTLQDLVFTPHGTTHWNRIYQVDKFQSLNFAMPDTKLLANFEQDAIAAMDGSTSTQLLRRKAEVVVNDGSAWLLQFEGSQFGPFSPVELGKILDSGKLKGALAACKVGTKTWFPITSIEQINQDPSTWGKINTAVDNEAGKRNAQRISLIATISRKLSEGTQMIGVCADISEGGMQVFNSTRAIFKMGESVDLVISPIASLAIVPFTVTAKVAWIKTEPSKIGFQFLDFDRNSSLRNYIDKATSHEEVTRA